MMTIFVVLSDKVLDILDSIIVISSSSCGGFWLYWSYEESTFLDID
jgi:hypothetical protein